MGLYKKELFLGFETQKKDPSLQNHFSATLIITYKVKGTAVISLADQSGQPAGELDFSSFELANSPNVGGQTARPASWRV